MVGDPDVGAAEVGLKVNVGDGEGISSTLQFGKKLKHSKPLGQSMLRPDCRHSSSKRMGSVKCQININQGWRITYWTMHLSSALCTGIHVS
jgi:hypothetical protein